MGAKHALVKLVKAVDRVFDLRGLMREADSDYSRLCGDRALEWSWGVAQLSRAPCRVLDVGCVGAPLTCIARRLGHAVTAVDLREIEYRMDGVTYRQNDITGADFAGQSFDVILNCSTVEHCGLEGRYGSGEEAAGDLLAMQSLRRLLASEGRMVLTIPVGRDAVFRPYHRVYGKDRLPQLLGGFQCILEEYWTRGTEGPWFRTDRLSALQTEGSPRFYALGLFVLQRDSGSVRD
jgi:SAM-dependent methyltransferase